MKPRLLDLFCGAGIASRGYQRAGFHVTGIDIVKQPRYAGDTFIQADAIDYVAAHGWEYDCIAASPPCQAHSQITPDKSKHLDLIPLTRFMLETVGVPYVIENVRGARKALRNSAMLCGTQFGLKVYRHRFFETNWMLLVPSHTPHNDRVPTLEDGMISITLNDKIFEFKVHAGAERRSGTYGISPKGFVNISGNFSGAEYCRWAMGVDWYVTKKELREAYPPAFAEYIGRQLLNHVLYQREMERAA